MRTRGRSLRVRNQLSRAAVLVAAARDARPLLRLTGMKTDLWEFTLREHDQETGLSAGTVSHDNELATNL